MNIYVTEKENKFKSGCKKAGEVIENHVGEIVSTIVIGCLVMHTTGYFIRSVKMR